jgi:hypothetical protein
MSRSGAWARPRTASRSIRSISQATPSWSAASRARSGRGDSPSAWYGPSARACPARSAVTPRATRACADGADVLVPSAEDARGPALVNSPASASWEIARLLAAELGSRAAWDQPPCLYAIRVTPDRFRLQPFPIPVAAWAAGAPCDILQDIAAAAEDAAGLPGVRRRGDLYGAAFRFERRRPDMPNADSQQRRQGFADVAAHRFPGRPDPIGYRALLAADWTGITYDTRQLRGQLRTLSEIFPPGYTLRRDGAIPGALRRMITAFTGVPLPQQGPEAGP